MFHSPLLPKAPHRVSSWVQVQIVFSCPQSWSILMLLSFLFQFKHILCMHTFVCFLTETTEISLKGKIIIKLVNHASFLLLGRKSDILQSDTTCFPLHPSPFSIPLIYGMHYLYINTQCSFSEQQSHVYISRGKLMEIHLATIQKKFAKCLMFITRF